MAPDPLRAVVAAVPLPCLVIGADDRLAQFNEAAEKLFGNIGIGRHYIGTLRQPNLLDAIEGTMADGVVRRTRFLGREGNKDTTWRATLAPVSVAGQGGVMATFEDITALEAAGQMRRDFVANVSHELRTPLTALLGFIETLKGAARNDPAARDRFLDIMDKEAGRMTRLVDDLLSLSRVEEDERIQPQAPVALDDLVRSVLMSLAPLAETAQVAVEAHLPDEAVIVPGDDQQVRQVITNLVENAIKYGQSGERIEVRLTPPAEEGGIRTRGVRLSVRDFGEGIPAHHLARLTERFYRVDTHRSREIGGTGLGLAIVKHIVNRHRGRLRIESEPGEGATFTVILPANRVP